MRRRWKVLLVIVVLLGFGASAVWLSASRPIVVRIPNGPTLTLYAVTEREFPFPNPDPLKDAWNNLRMRFWMLRSGKTKAAVMGLAGTNTVYLWFKSDPPVLNGQLPVHVVLEGDANTSGRKSYAGMMWSVEVPNAISLYWRNCPTNQRTLKLSFYRSLSSGSWSDSEMNDQTFVSTIEVKNPANR